MEPVQPLPPLPPRIERWIATLWRRRWLAAWSVLVLILLALPALRGVRVDNTLEVWVERDSEAYSDYEEFLQRFGSEEYILLVDTLPEPAGELDLDFLEGLTDLRLDLEDIEGVGEVQDLSQVYSQFFALQGIEAFRADLRGSPFYRSFLLSPDGRRAGVWIRLNLHAPEERQRIVEAVEEVVAANEERLGRKFEMAGSPVVSVTLDRYSRRASRQFFPPVFLISAALLWLLYRSWRTVILPFLTVGAGITWTMALLSLTGHTLNLVTVALPPIVWVLGLATAIHLLSRCQALLDSGLGTEVAVRDTLRDLLRPCLFSSLTTALGFGSLLVAELPPVRQMGLFAAFGVLACLVSTVLLFPALSSLLLRPRPERVSLAMAAPRFEGWLASLAVRHPLIVIVGAGLVTLACGGAILKVHAESNVLKFFKEDAPITGTYKRLMADFTGPYSMEVLVRPPEGATLESFRRLEALQQAIAARPEVARVLSPVDLVKKVYQRAEGLPPETYRLPPDEARFQEIWALAGDQVGAERDQTAKDGVMRLSALVRVMGSGEHTRLVRAVEAELEALPDGPDWQPRITGIVTILVELQERLLRSQIESFALAFVVIGLVMALLLRSLRHALVSLPPNLLPVLLALGVMGILGIALDPATMMIAGVALGVAVDDSIHFLAHYRQERRQGVEREAAVRATLERVGRPIALTSGVAAGGFFVLCLSDFVPLIHFGLLTGVTLGTALVADLLLLPALLVGLPRWWQAYQESQESRRGQQGRDLGGSALTPWPTIRRPAVGICGSTCCGGSAW